ncbi:hypothetical protein ACFL54_09260, partial [Planctomycetota bacterium]
VKPEIFFKAAKWLMENQDKEGPEVRRVEGKGEGERSGDEQSYVPVAQDRARGWAYIRKAEKREEGLVCGGMTTVGICSLIICKAHLVRHASYKAIKERLNQSIFDGFGWLTNNWSVNQNPGTRRSFYYYLYGLERVGVMGGFDYIGGHNWYHEGARSIVPRQRPDGCWMANQEVNPKDILGTCFALLFLKRGTIPISSGEPER